MLYKNHYLVPQRTFQWTVPKRTITFTQMIFKDYLDYQIVLHTTLKKNAGLNMENPAIGLLSTNSWVKRLTQPSG